MPGISPNSPKLMSGKTEASSESRVSGISSLLSPGEVPRPLKYPGGVRVLQVLCLLPPGVIFLKLDGDTQAVLNKTPRVKFCQALPGDSRFYRSKQPSRPFFVFQMIDKIV